MSLEVDTVKENWKLSADGKFWYDPIDGCCLPIDATCLDCDGEPHDVYDIHESEFLFSPIFEPLCENCFKMRKYKDKNHNNMDIKAVQWAGDNIEEICKKLNIGHKEISHIFGSSDLIIHTSEDEKIAKKSDWIVRKDNLLHSVRHDIFEATYKTIEAVQKTTRKKQDE